MMSYLEEAGRLADELKREPATCTCKLRSCPACDSGHCTFCSDCNCNCMSCVD